MPSVYFLDAIINQGVVLLKKINFFLFVLGIVITAFILNGCMPGNSNSLPVVLNLPSNWSYVASIAIGNGVVLLGGTLSNASGAIGMYDLKTGIFSDLSNQMQSLYFQRVSSITFLKGMFYISGYGINGAIFASFNPFTNVFTLLNNYIPFNAGNFSIFNSVSTDGTSILIGGVGSKSPLLIYNPSNPYTFSIVNGFDYYTEVNGVLWDGSEYLIDGVDQNVGILYLLKSGVLVNVSDDLPPYTSILGAMGYNGQEFLIWSKNNSTLTWSNGYYQMLSFNVQNNVFNSISSSIFATSLSVPSNGITGVNGWFIIGGRILSQPYFVKYNLTGSPIDLSFYLPNNVSGISSVSTDGNNIYVTGNYLNGNVFFEIVKGQV